MVQERDGDGQSGTLPVELGRAFRFFAFVFASCHAPVGRHRRVKMGCIFLMVRQAHHERTSMVSSRSS